MNAHERRRAWLTDDECRFVRGLHAEAFFGYVESLRWRVRWGPIDSSAVAWVVLTRLREMGLPQPRYLVAMT